MKFLILTVGSDGDVFPMASLGGHLSSRGHDVTLVGTSGYADIADQNGMGFVPLSDAEASARSIEDKWILATRYSLLHVKRFGVFWNRVIYETIHESANEDLVVVSTDRPNLWADLFARARLGVRVIRVQVDLPFLGGVRGQTLLLPLGCVQRHLAVRCEAAWKRTMAARGFDTAHLRWERLWGSVRRTVPMIALWPSWILGEQTSRYAFPTFGFLPPPKFCTPGGERLLGVASNRKVVVFVAGTAGTTRCWAKRFLETSAQICRQLHCTGVFLGGDPVTDSGWPPDMIVRQPFVPLRDVLKGASALVHHGGIGTAAAAIECGVPQLVIPRVFRQPANAEWLRRLGLCLVIHPKDYTTSRGCVALQDLLTNSRYWSVARKYASRCDTAVAVQSLCEYVESATLAKQFGISGGPPRQAGLIRGAQ